MRAQSLPLFPEPLPFMRPHIKGFEKGDRVAIPCPRARSLERTGTVIVTFPHHNEVVLKADDTGAIVTIAPERCRKISVRAQ